MTTLGRSKKWDRFAHYFLGVAIGCVLVGVMLQARSRMRANDRARRDAEQAALQEQPIPPAAETEPPAAPNPE